MTRYTLVVNTGPNGGAGAGGRIVSEWESSAPATPRELDRAFQDTRKRWQDIVDLMLAGHPRADPGAGRETGGGKVIDG